MEVVSKTDVRVRGSRMELLRTLSAASGAEAAVLGDSRFWTEWCAIADPKIVGKAGAALRYPIQIRPDWAGVSQKVRQFQGRDLNSNRAASA